jgi:hypothetical protein
MSTPANLRSQLGNGYLQAPAGMKRLERNVLIAGVVGAAACVAGAVLYPAEQFLRSYLLAYMFWLGISLGALAILMLAHVTSAEWAFPVRRVLEAASKNLLGLAVLFIPILVGVRQLFAWARPAALTGEHLQQQHIYLNIPFFVVRAVIYFACWIFLTWLLTRWSALQDAPPDRGYRSRYQKLSGFGLVIYGWTMTFAAVDWMMSLDNHWRSTVYGFYVEAGQGLNAFSFLVIVAALLWAYRPISDIMTETHLHDMGKLMFAFLILWAYMAFSQGLIYWAANMPSEISWYVARTTGGWWWIGVALIVLQFFLPFFLLLSQDLKRDPHKIIWIAGFVMVMRWVDLYWLIIPNFPDTKGHLTFSWMNIATMLGIGGLWVFAFLRNLAAQPVIPLHDPMIYKLLEPIEESETAIARHRPPSPEAHGD